MSILTVSVATFYGSTFDKFSGQTPDTTNIMDTQIKYICSWLKYLVKYEHHFILISSSRHDMRTQDTRAPDMI